MAVDDLTRAEDLSTSVVLREADPMEAYQEELEVLRFLVAVRWYLQATDFGITFRPDPLVRLIESGSQVHVVPAPHEVRLPLWAANGFPHHDLLAPPDVLLAKIAPHDDEASAGSLGVCANLVREPNVESMVAKKWHVYRNGITAPRCDLDQETEPNQGVASKQAAPGFSEERAQLREVVASNALGQEGQRVVGSASGQPSCSDFARLRAALLREEIVLIIPAVVSTDRLVCGVCGNRSRSLDPRRRRARREHRSESCRSKGHVTA